jgi:cytochrome c553
MKLAGTRSVVALFLSVVSAGTAAALINCAAPGEEDVAPSEEAVTGVNNALGLGLRFDDRSGTLQATLKKELAPGERLYLRVRRGKLSLTSQKDLLCTDLAAAGAVRNSGSIELTGKTVYQGPKVDPSVIALLHLFDDPQWATGDVSAAQLADAKNPDPIVEACVMKGTQVRAKLQTNLAYAWDQGVKEAANLKTASSGRVHLTSNDAGLESDGEVAVDGGGAEDAGQGPGEPVVVPPPEETVNSQITYGQLCVDELGEIPFFNKLANGSYDTFDCRDWVGTNAAGPTGPMPGVETSRIPVTVDGVAQENCSPGKELGPDSSSYSCMDKADHGMFLATGGVQPGPTVVTAKNDRGTEWVLLCRKVADDGRGMMKSKRFNDIAMIGHNPGTGRTCFFQNAIGSGKDGEHVSHPADVEKSTHIWASGVPSYCSGSCHAADPFVHSPWIDGAKRSNGKSIVPKLGELTDFPISNPEAPYSIIAADRLGFSIPKQLVSDEVGACTNCHRVAGNTGRDFARWATGTGDEYYGKITDLGKTFAQSHWMPLRLDGMSEQTWATSRYGKAMEVIETCAKNAADPRCIWADVPRGRFDNPRIRP